MCIGQGRQCHTKSAAPKAKPPVDKAANDQPKTPCLSACHHVPTICRGRIVKPFPWVSRTAYISRHTKGLAEKPGPFHVASCCDLFSFVFNGSRLVRVSRCNMDATEITRHRAPPASIILGGVSMASLRLRYRRSRSCRPQGVGRGWRRFPGSWQRRRSKPGPFGRRPPTAAQHLAERPPGAPGRVLIPCRSPVAPPPESPTGALRKPQVGGFILGYFFLGRFDLGCFILYAAYRQQ